MISASPGVPAGASSLYGGHSCLRPLRRGKGAPQLRLSREKRAPSVHPPDRQMPFLRRVEYLTLAEAGKFRNRLRAEKHVRCKRRIVSRKRRVVVVIGLSRGHLVPTRIGAVPRNGRRDWVGSSSRVASGIELSDARATAASLCRYRQGHRRTMSSACPDRTRHCRA